MCGAVRQLRDVVKQAAHLKQGGPARLRLGAESHPSAARLVEHPFWNHMPRLVANELAAHTGAPRILPSSPDDDLPPVERMPRVAHDRDDPFLCVVP